jgi:hypothetical protein
MPLLRRLAVISVLGCAAPLLLVFMAGCHRRPYNPNTYRREQALADIFNPEKIRESLNQSRTQKNQDNLAEGIESLAAALEAQARDLRANGSSTAADKSEKEAKELRKEARKIRRGDPLR